MRSFTSFRMTNDNNLIKMITNPQKQRYLRNTILPEIGEEGQEKLLAAKVLVIGAGGLGSPVLLYLAAAGVGNIGVVDDDVVELSNLQRQVIHNLQNLNQKKVESAREKISALNPDINLTIFSQRANREFLRKICVDYDFILDCTDNFQTRFIINEICHQQKKPLIFAAVKGFLGQVSVFKSYENSNPCYACFNPNIVDENFSLPLSEKGILGSVAGTIGALQATTTIKEILGIGESLVGKILICDFLKNEFRKTSLKKNLQCKVCRN
jgi:molybdopterin-synthase adenylyltransferase